MKYLVTAAAVAALVAISPSYGQDAQAPEAQPAPTLQVPETPQPAPTAEAPAPETAAPKADAQAAPATNPSGVEFVQQQGEDEMLISSLVGATVYDPADDSLGDINDVVYGKDGKITAVTIGVGGFLGIGEKQVAVAFEAIDLKPTDDGVPKLVLAATKEGLKSAPDFLTLADIQRQKEMEQAQQQAAPGMEPATPMN